MEAAASTIATPIPATTSQRSAARVKQLSLRGIIGVWAAAALPMGLLAWVVAPLLADQLSGSNRLSRALIVLLTAGLVWQFALVMFLVKREWNPAPVRAARRALVVCPCSSKTVLLWRRSAALSHCIGFVFTVQGTPSRPFRFAGCDFGDSSRMVEVRCRGRQGAGFAVWLCFWIFKHRAG